MERTQSKGKNCKLNFVEPIQLLMASCLTWGLNLDLLSCPFSFSLNFEIAVTLYDALTDVLRLSWGGVSVGCWGWLWISAAFIFRVQKYVAGVRTPARGRDFLFSKNYVDRLWGQPSCLFSGYRSFCPRVKRPGRDADHWSATSAEAKNEWSCICTSSCALVLCTGTNLPFFTDEIKTLLVAPKATEERSKVNCSCRCLSWSFPGILYRRRRRLATVLLPL